ncbi:Sodium:neurotransmitter symporter family protein [Ancylostoma ceylanicum]|uniref:Sodium:neurotransmitter symporter family protein n=1 Tax=Ancylostoma ceylanicum TaxID=53326 RepID=A0A0D6LP87_9BILA|nr:Sodium:neurotransmitter symporter family protein [Ancylostoma ceylanicum]
MADLPPATDNPPARKLSRGRGVLSALGGLGTAAEYQPLPAEKPVTLAVRESDSIEPMAGLSPRVESRVSALRRRSSQARDRWATKMEFLLAVIGYAVDLGNIWRFPSVCYKHGGGIGYGICFICTFIACFYNAIISHAVYFVVSSIAFEVPWKTCNNSWNTPLCTDTLNATLGKSGERLTTPSEEFYFHRVLEIQKSTGFDDIGGVKPSMALCLAFVFLLVYFALWKGPKSSGKMVWVTATAPYIVLTILLIRGVTLPGAAKGIYYYLTPDFAKLTDPKVINNLKTWQILHNKSIAMFSTQRCRGDVIYQLLDFFLLWLCHLLHTWVYV